MKRITFFTLLFAAALFLLAGVTYFFLSHSTKASVVITNPRIENIVGTGAQVKWETNVPSDSRVAYGLNPTYTLFSNNRCDDGGYVTSHCVNLTGLAQGTVYYYKVESADMGGVENSLSGAQFTSAAQVLNDPTLPAAPSSLSVSLSENGAEATFTWGDASSDETVFKMWRRLQGNIAWEYFISADMNTTSFLYSGVPFGTYEYYIVACSGFGCSSVSNAVSVTRRVAPDTTAPSIPQNVTAVVVSSSQIALSWEASTDDVSVSGYNVYRDGTFVGNTSALSYSDSTLTPATSYSYAVAAKDSSGNLSSGSYASAATTFSEEGGISVDTTPPVISSIEEKNITGTGAEVIWITDEGANSTLVYGTVRGLYPFASTRRCDAGGNITNHCINIIGLTPGTHYYYQLVSKNAAGYETKSAEQSFTSASITETVSSAATTTVTATTALNLTPVVFSVKVGTPFCKDGRTFAPVYLTMDRAVGGYFILKNNITSSSQTIDGGSRQLQDGMYSWQGIPKIGYYAAGGTSGAFTVPSLTACAPAAITPLPTTSTVVNNTKTTNADAKIAPKPVPIAPAPVKNPPAEVLRNEITAQEAVSTKNYREVESVLIQKYQDEENLFRKGNKMPVESAVPVEEKRKLVEKVYSQFSVLAPAADFVLIGTTTLSRTGEPERIVAEASRVMAERTETPAFTDTDSDSISDYDETHIYGTNPNKSDTDTDGINDSEEILIGTNPLEKVLVPVPHEDPKESVPAVTIDSKTFSVQKVETVLVSGNASSTETARTRVAFEGTGLPNSFVTIYIFSAPVVVTVKTDSDGKWKYTMDKELEDGNHEIYVAMTESAGKILAKSDAIPFVKTADAAELSSDFVLADSPVKNSVAFFRGGMPVIALIVLFFILGFSLITISFVSRKKDE